MLHDDRLLCHSKVKAKELLPRASLSIPADRRKGKEARIGDAVVHQALERNVEIEDTILSHRLGRARVGGEVEGTRNALSKLNVNRDLEKGILTGEEANPAGAGTSVVSKTVVQINDATILEDGRSLGSSRLGNALVSISVGGIVEAVERVGLGVEDDLIGAVGKSNLLAQRSAEIKGKLRVNRVVAIDTDRRERTHDAGDRRDKGNIYVHRSVERASQTIVR